MLFSLRLSNITLLAFSYLLFITSSVDGDLGCFCLLAAFTVGEQISAQVSLQFFWTCTRKWRC